VPSRGATLRLRRFALDRAALPRGTEPSRSASLVGIHRRTRLVADTERRYADTPGTYHRPCPFGSTEKHIADVRPRRMLSTMTRRLLSVTAMPILRHSCTDHLAEWALILGRRKRGKISNRRAFSCTALSAHSFFRRTFACEDYLYDARFADGLQTLARSVL